jgi:hypothetical protein
LVPVTHAVAPPATTKWKRGKCRSGKICKPTSYQNKLLCPLKASYKGRKKSIAAAKHISVWVETVTEIVTLDGDRHCDSGLKAIPFLILLRETVWVRFLASLRSRLRLRDMSARGFFSWVQCQEKVTSERRPLSLVCVQQRRCSCIIAGR